VLGGSQRLLPTPGSPCRARLSSPGGRKPRSRKDVGARSGTEIPL